MANITIMVADTTASFTDLESLIEELLKDPTDNRAMRRTQDQVNAVLEALVELDKATKMVKETVEAKRIPVSLQRFDGWFNAFGRSQNARWFAFDLLVPIILGGLGIFLLVA